MGAVLLCLLFQQAAMAGYVCPQPAALPHPGAVMDDCAAMGMATPDHAAPAHPADPRCGEHCVHHVPGTSHVQVATLAPVPPPLSLLVSVRSVLLRAPAWRVPGPDPHPPDPPISLRFCSLLI